MKSLRKYRTYDGGEYKEQQNETLPPSDGSEVTAEKLETYLAMDDQSRWQLLLSKVTEAKKSGMMSDSDLDAFAQSCRGMISEEQYAHLIQLITTLKS